MTWGSLGARVLTNSQFNFCLFVCFSWLFSGISYPPLSHLPREWKMPSGASQLQREPRSPGQASHGNPGHFFSAVPGDLVRYLWFFRWYLLYMQTEIRRKHAALSDGLRKFLWPWKNFLLTSTSPVLFNTRGRKKWSFWRKTPPQESEVFLLFNLIA